jgi:hypothetical protein
MGWCIDREGVRKWETNMQTRLNEKKMSESVQRMNIGELTFTLFEVGLLDKRGNPPSQVIYQANGFDATGNDLVFAIAS